MCLSTPAQSKEARTLKPQMLLLHYRLWLSQPLLRLWQLLDSFIVAFFVDLTSPQKRVRGMAADASCPRCEAGIENVDHLLCGCMVSIAVWEGVSKGASRSNFVEYRVNHVVQSFTKLPFYDEADKNYWKAIAELLPIELPTIEINKGNKDHEKKPPIVVIHGPKPTDHSRMQQVLLKLKHIEPNHLKPAPVAPAPSKAA
ncbi:hypothetical protein Q3G72_030945 [Acer saccharum]|nr:hypothetical protein Q3G72_030945 [Acer saccharum]